jgi:ATP-dependent Clp protease ATP-binding subunit ClpC
MSEYMEKFNVSRLGGAPPGYVGYNEGGQLTEQVRRRPYSVVLFDEIEKAHPDVFNILLQVLEDGHMTDSTGRKVDFRNTVIVMTSNIGARRIGRNTSVGFRKLSAEDEYKDMRSRVMDEVKKVFNPEFLNRIDEIVVFHHLGHEEMVEIVDIHMAEVLQRARDKGLELILTDEGKEFIVRHGSDEQYGARPLRRAVQQYIEDPLSELLLKGAFEPGTRIQMRPADLEEKLVFEPAVPVAEGVTT